MDEQFKASLVKTSFAGKPGHKVGECENGVIVKRYILDKLLSSWKVKGKKIFFPGPMAVSVTKINLQNIVTQSFKVCEKSDGERFLLFITKICDLKVCMFINRNLDIYVHSLYFDDSVYQNTIIDGELIVPEKGNVLFMSFDVVCSCGVNVKKNNLDDRLSELYSILSSKYTPSGILKVHMKKFFDLKDLNLATKTMNKYYPSDGLIFTPVNLSVMENTHYTLLKWKDRDTIDFEIENFNGDKYLSLVNDKSLQKIQYTETSFNFGDIVECEYVDKEWIPCKVRPDKNKPNTTKTLERTMVTINDNIDINYIKSLLKEHSIL